MRDLYRKRNTIQITLNIRVWRVDDESHHMYVSSEDL